MNFAMRIGSIRRAVALMFIAAASIVQGRATEYYVSTRGDDANAGTQADPFRSLERARDAARDQHRDQKVVIWLRGGIHEREQPFVLTAEDSRTNEGPIEYRGYPDEDVRLVGGKVIAGWVPVSDPEARTRLSPEARDKVLQSELKAQGVTDYGGVAGGGLELFFRDRPMTLARWPNQGFVKITGLVEPDTVNVRGTRGSKTGKFMYEGDRPTGWVGEKDPWVHGYWFWDWSDQRHAIEAIDVEQRMLAVKPPYHGYGYRVGQWFYGLNILAELDSPGEWYLDRETGILYFWPPDEMAAGDAVVSTIPTLVTLTDVSHVTVQDITLEACRQTAVTIHGGTQIHLRDCTLRNLGGYAVQIADASESGVSGCEIYQTGDGGISLNGGDRKSLSPAHLYAENNRIHHYGRWNRMYKAAIHLSGVGNRASHNLIHHAPHMAIGFGGNDHLIEFNEIHDVCYESNDAGAIYAGRDWTMRGTIIRHNYLHDIRGFQGKGCVGVYLDDMFCGTTIYGNVFYRVTRAAFIGGGKDCTIENNIFVDCPKALHVDARAMSWAKFHVGTTMTKRLLAMPYTSEPWRTRYPELLPILDGDPTAPTGNRVVRNVFVGDGWDDIHPAARKYLILEGNVTDEDSPFVSAPPASFQLHRNASAHALGFQPIPFEAIGPNQEKAP